MTGAERPSVSQSSRTPARAAAPAAGSPKIHAAHREKLALAYVRQSSPQQVLANRESTLRQYALVDYACALGWPRERTVVIDEDQGQSGRSAAGRVGFQRLLAEVGMDHVGLILRALSRMA
jgi:DNA invertase Pin-like site-specific DNA recombinase